MAEVSGPGQFSKRTDTQGKQALPDAQYGENKDYQEQQSGAKQAASPGGNVDFASLFGNPADKVTPLSAPSTQPQTAVTDGAALGAGAGTEALGLPDQSAEDLQKLVPYMPVLEYMANQQGASWAMRNVVRKVKAMM